MRRLSVGQPLWTVAQPAGIGAAIAGARRLVGPTGGRWPSGGELAYRWQSVWLASLVGASLACAGVTYQAILRNPLAEPYLLGVSSGASLAAYLWRFPVFSTIAVLGSAVTQQVFAFAGA